MHDGPTSELAPRPTPRVLISALRYPPGLGGVERYLADISASAERSGAFRPTVITSDLSVHATGERIVDPPDDGVERLRTRPVLWSWRYPLPAGLRRRLMTAVKDADVLHAAPIYFNAFDMALWVAHRTGAPIVINPHGYPRRISYWPYYRAVALAARHTRSCVVSVSMFERTVLERMGLVTDQTDVVQISPLIGANRHLDLDRQVGADGLVRLLYVGRLDRGKGVLDLPGVLDGVRRRGLDATLTVVGPDGPPEQVAALRAAAAERPHLTIAGEVTREEKDRLMAEADFLVLPTRYEAFGIVLVEAMRAGTVPVAYPVAAVPEVLGHGEFGVLPDRAEPEAMADAIVEVARDPGRLARLRARSAEHASAAYGEARWDLAWAELYARMAAR